MESAELQALAVNVTTEFGSFPGPTKWLDRRECGRGSLMPPSQGPFQPPLQFRHVNLLGMPCQRRYIAHLPAAPLYQRMSQKKQGGSRWTACYHCQTLRKFHLTNSQASGSASMAIASRTWIVNILPEIVWPIVGGVLMRYLLCYRSIFLVELSRTDVQTYICEWTIQGSPLSKTKPVTSTTPLDACDPVPARLWPFQPPLNESARKHAAN